LSNGGFNFNNLPAWQRWGVDVYWQAYTKTGVDPRTGETKQGQRRRLYTDLNLPLGEAYVAFIRQRLAFGEEDEHA